MINEKDVTIIVPHLGETREQEFSLDQCLASLNETTTSRVIVVKNGKACPHKRDIRILEQGQCKAVNAGVAMTNTPWILVTNDDMIYPRGWFDRLTQLPMVTRIVDLDDQNIFCISPQLVEPRPGAPTFLEYFCGGAGGDFDKQKWLEYAARKDEGYGLRTGFNLPFLMKRELWDTIGGYDINYDPWGSNSDSDLEYKIRLAGIQPYQNTNCIVYHFSQTSGTFHPDNQGAWQKNWDYFIQKWGFPRTDDGIWEANFNIPTVEEGRIFSPWWEGKYA